MGTRRGERGQASLEAALVFPVVVITTFSLLQGGWTMFCFASLSYAIEHAQYAVTAEEAAAATDVDELFASKMKAAAPILATGTLSVTSTRVEAQAPAVRSEALPDADFDAYRFATKNERTMRVKVTSHIEYTPAMFVGVMPAMTGIRDIESSKLASERFELG